MASSEMNQETQSSIAPLVKKTSCDATANASRANRQHKPKDNETMNKMMHTLKYAMVTALGFGLSGGWEAPVAAASFSNRPIPESQVVATAAPIGSNSHQLIILEQISSERECWQDNGATIDPLLLNFDFVGICGRATGSNGATLFVGGEDLGWRYAIRIMRDGDNLRLTAQSTSDSNAPTLELGTAQEVDGELVEINLNSGWSITKRVYNGEPVLHYYLTNDQPLETLLAESRQLLPRVPPTQPTTPDRPTSERPTPTQPTVPGAPTSLPTLIPSSERLGDPTSPATPSPTTPVPVTPSPTTPTRQPTRIPAPSVGQGDRSSLNYRVIALENTEDGRRRVRAIVADAFPITVDGVSVMQAGVFRQLAEAEVLRQRLRIYGIDARTLNIASQTSNPPSTPTPRPITPPRQPTTLPTQPTVPNGRFVVVLDPGHGGRDPGAVGIGGLRETTVVNDVTRQVASILQQRGVQVVLTRNTGQFVDLAPRVAIAERSNADIFVSIHANAISLSRPEVNGAETYYYSSAAGRRLAQSIQQTILRQTGMGDRGVREARFFVLRNTSMPSVLVETGFVTGAQDAPRLNNPTFRSQMAEAIAIGILNYLQ
ncbi:MAG: N-acetylmuramoyl-L-alanine amidase [Cyanobacteria bacterium P01_E01_bin.6]